MRRPASAERAERTVDAAEPASSWASVALRVPRRGHAATKLSDGSVVVCGGESTRPGGELEALKSCERLLPDGSEWQPLPDLPEARAHLDLIALGAPNRMLVTGGTIRADVVPNAREGSLTGWGEPEPALGRVNHTTSRMNDGSVLVVGGTNPSLGVLVAGAELRDAEGVWLPVGGQARMAHAAALIEDRDAVLVSGGYADPSAQTPLKTAAMYSAGAWHEVAPMKEARAHHTLTPLDDGSVLAVGGIGDDYELLTTSWRYVPSEDRWVPAAAPRVARVGHAAAKLGRYVVVAGGEVGSGTMTASVEVYDFVSDSWADLVPLREPRAYLTLTALGQSGLVAAGGSDNFREFATAEIIAPQALGSACEGGEGCLSGHCVDAVCCESACAGSCSACAADGSCQPVDGAPVPGRSACAGGLACDDGACLTRCSSNDDCLDGRYCDAGKCLERKSQGAPCDAGADECDEGLHCVDGVCCDSPCTGQCESCNGRGVCSVAPRGPAPPEREACATGEAPECGAECDGRHGDRCRFAAEERTCGEASCQDGYQRFSGSGVCDGRGACALVPENRISCRGYTCRGLACGTDCRSDADCLAGYHCEGVDGCVADCSSNADCTGVGEICDAGRCRSGCTPDRRQQLDGQDCGAYVCGWRDGRCLTSCSSNWDCAPGNFCDPAGSVCRAAPFFDGTLSGCAVSAVRPGHPLAALASTLLLAAFGVRRRSRADVRSRRT